MSASKHTPGPWQRSGIRQSIADFKGHAVGPDGDPVVIVPYNDKQHAECLANADLIAAAPELLKALKACRLELDYCADQLAHTGRVGAEDGSVATALRLGSAAIAKAEGSK